MPRPVERVAFFPTFAELRGNPYWDCLRSALERRGLTFEDAPPILSVGWLRERRREVQVLHFHFIQQHYAYEGTHARTRWVARFARNLVLARALGYRTIFTLHNLEPTYPLRPAWADYLGHWAASNLSNAVIVHGAAARQALASRYGRRSRVSVMPHPNYIGVYADSISVDAARTRLGLHPEHLVYAFVGGLRPNKGVDKLIAAFRTLEGEHLRLVIAGKAWPPASYFERLQAHARADHRIRLYPGVVADNELQVYLRAADVIVCPFESVLTSGSTMLAMSFGRPVVVPARGCLPETVSAAEGFVYDPSQENSLVGALRQCASANLAEMGLSARSRVKPLTWDNLAAHTHALYDSHSVSQPTRSAA